MCSSTEKGKVKYETHKYGFDLIEIVHLVAGAFFHTSKVCQLHMTLPAKKNKTSIPFKRTAECCIMGLFIVGLGNAPVQHDIFWLQIPINDPSLVKVFQCQQDLFRECNRMRTVEIMRKEDGSVHFNNNGLVASSCFVLFMLWHHSLALWLWDEKNT